MRRATSATPTAIPTFAPIASSFLPEPVADEVWVAVEGVPLVFDGVWLAVGDCSGRCSSVIIQMGGTCFVCAVRTVTVLLEYMVELVHGEVLVEVFPLEVYGMKELYVLGTVVLYRKVAACSELNWL